MLTFVVKRGHPNPIVISKYAITLGMDDLGNNTKELTSIRAASGDKGFPSSQTTKSETSSTTPAKFESINYACSTVGRCIETITTEQCKRTFI